MPETVRYGRRERLSFAKIEEVLDMPNLIEIQQRSYQWFLDEGLRKMFRDISPIQDFTGNLVLEFIDYALGEPKYDVDECKERDVTFSAPLRVRVRLINKETGEVKEQEVFMGDFPLMTDKGTFIINGAERVVVSQLVRSPGVYFSSTVDTSGRTLYSALIMPNVRGAWLEFEFDANDVLYVRIDRTRKTPVTVLLRALGFGTNAKILELFEDKECVRNTLERDNTQNEDEALVEIFKRLRPGEPPTVDTARTLFESLFFDPRRYDLAAVGRYKLNKELNLDIPLRDEFIVKAEGGRRIHLPPKVYDRILIALQMAETDGAKMVIGASAETLGYFADYLGLPVTDGRLVLGQKDYRTWRGRFEQEVERIEAVKTLTKADITGVVRYLITLLEGKGEVDDIDHLGNRRLSG